MSEKELQVMLSSFLPVSGLWGTKWYVQGSAALVLFFPSFIVRKHWRWPAERMELSYTASTLCFWRSWTSQTSFPTSQLYFLSTHRDLVAGSLEAQEHIQSINSNVNVRMLVVGCRLQRTVMWLSWTSLWVLGSKGRKCRQNYG